MVLQQCGWCKENIFVMHRNVIPSGKRNLCLAIRRALVLESHELVEDVASGWLSSWRAHGTRMWSVNRVYLKYMQFLLYLVYIGQFWVVLLVKQPISAFIRGTGRISQLVFPPPGVITVKEQQNQESLFYTKVPSPMETLLPHKGWADPFSTVFSPLYPRAYTHGIWLN